MNHHTNFRVIFSSGIFQICSGHFNMNSWLKYLNIIELTMWPCGWPCVRVCGNLLLERLMSPSPQSQVMFTSYFWHSYFLSYGYFLHTGCTYYCGIHELCTRAEPCNWSVGANGVTTILVVSLRARHNTTQVMLGGVTVGQVRHNSTLWNYRT